MSNDKEYTHYIVVNEVILGNASIVEKLKRLGLTGLRQTRSR